MASAQDQLLRHRSVVGEARARLRLAAAPRARRRLAPAILAGAAAAAAIAALVAWRSPLTFAVGDDGVRGQLGAPIVAPASRPVDLVFSDGSYLALGPAGRARVTTIDHRGAAILVEHGHADVSVVPHRNGRWRVDVGPFEVLVKGTRFSISWDPDEERLDFQLHKGAVVITAPCLPGGRALVEGQSLRASCRAPRPAPSVAAAAPAERAPRPDEGAAPQAPPARSAARPQASTWRQLAGEQDYRAALDAAVRAGFDREVRRSSPSDLLWLGDVARLAGDPARALLAYEAARQKRPAADRSAFAIGLVEFDHRHRYRRAADWFEAYIAEQPAGPLVEEAEGRLMEAWQRAGEPAKARAAGQQYLARHPRGLYSDLARRLTQ
jgi:hypothetical protein